MCRSVQQVGVSAVVVTFQAVGTLLLALIIAQLARIFVFHYARLWALAWSALSFGLLAVRASIAAESRLWWAAFLIGEWLFLMLLWAGCRELVGRVAVPRRPFLLSLPLLVICAIALAESASGFNSMFAVQAAIVVIGAAASFITLTGRATSKGTRTLQASLAAMALLFASYVPLFWMHEHGSPMPFLVYSSLLDLLANVFLGCGMILVTAEAEKRDLNTAISALAEAQARAEQRLQTDPLTEVMSRHAFQVVQHGEEVATEGVLAGVVAMIDVDELKRINDEMGHAAGDVVIRAAANEVRNLIRADDLLFRWGGDEFVAIMPNMTKEAAAARFAKLDDVLVGRSDKGFEIPFQVSWGVAEFGPDRLLDEAIKFADGRMYEAKGRPAEVGHKT